MPRYTEIKVVKKALVYLPEELKRRSLPAIINGVSPRARRRDEKHQEIRDGLRELGLPVLDVASYPGCLDLLTQHKGSGELVWLEIKTEGEDLTDSEAKRFEEFDGARIYIVYTLEEAASACGVEVW